MCAPTGTEESNEAMKTKALQTPDKSIGGGEIDASVLLARMRARLTGIGGVDLRVPPREPTRDPPDFSGPEFDAPDEHRSISSRGRP